MQTPHFLSDEALCSQAAAGDSEAEEALALRYSKLVRVCARPYFLAGGDSEDLIQEGMIGLLSAIRGYSPERRVTFRTFAETCIRNRLRSAVRAAGRQKHTPLNEAESLSGQPGDLGSLEEWVGSSGDPEELFIGREEQSAWMERLETLLSALELQVLALYLQGIPYAEIAKQLDRPVKSVDNAIQRIRSKLEAEQHA